MPTMEAQPDIQAVGLQPITIARAYGLTGYNLVTDQNELLNNQDLQVFRDEAHARNHLTRGARAPLSCTRVFTLSDLSYGTRRHLPYASIYVTDKPVICDLSHPSDITNVLTKFGALPCSCSRDEIDSFLSKNRGFRLSSKSEMFGLPSLRLVKLTKAGFIPRTPGEAIREKRRQFLLEHSCFTLAFHEKARALLSAMLTVQVGSPHGDDNAPNYDHVLDMQKRNRRFDTHQFRLILSNIAPSVYRYHTIQFCDYTWVQTVTECAHWNDALAGEIEGFLDDDGSNWYCLGPLRTPVIFLNRHRRQQALDFLALFHSLLPRLRDFPPITPKSKFEACSHEHAQSAKKCLRLHNALIRFARAMKCTAYPCHSVSHLFKDPIHVV